MKLNNVLKIKKGISLIVLIVTIIVVIILAAVVILTINKDGGIINKARYAKDEYNKIEYRDRINEAYTIVKNKQEMQGKSDREIFEEVKKSLNFEKAKYEISDKSMNITTKEGYEYTLIGDGNIYDEKVAILDIAEGTILLDKDGYIQGTKPKVIYNGKYIITGTAKEKYVKVRNEGTYDITIKDLNIDMSTLDYGCPFNANGKATGCFVNLTLEGNNYLKGNGVGLGFAGATPNVNGVTNGSTLTISGSGSLEASSNGWAAGIGSGYGYGWNNNAMGTVSNIVINSGNIIARGNSHSSGIGCVLNGSVNNIIINGGNINSNGIGATWAGTTADNIIINGGIIYSTRWI